MIPVVLVVEDHHRGNVQSAYFEGVEGGKCRVDTAESPVAHGVRPQRISWISTPNAHKSTANECPEWSIWRQ